MVKLTSLIKMEKKSYLIPAISPKGNKYVKTVNDETSPDCLLMLPDCV